VLNGKKNIKYLNLKYNYLLNKSDSNNWNHIFKIAEAHRIANLVDTIDLEEKVEEILHPDNEFRKKTFFIIN
jgi:hypothetical protein